MSVITSTFRIRPQRRGPYSTHVEAHIKTISATLLATNWPARLALGCARNAWLTLSAWQLLAIAIGLFAAFGSALQESDAPAAGDD